ncbi:ABC transporter permease [Aliirhizobium smilacinae]|uniref:ABC transporter permease n=2 Tax=Aliirhizobium smilacinae TaxID=1395944 RepID=A0A5C4XLR5_9HYPH|nr:ABC transporter permease [Rhizobium smilacinae]
MGSPMYQQTTSDIAIERPLPSRDWRPIWLQAGMLVLLLPMTLFLLLFFLLPAINLLGYSIQTQNAQGIIGAPLTLAHFAKFFTVDLYLRVLWNTLRISFWTCIYTALLAYPVAIAIVSARPTLSRVISLIVIAPLVVSVVVRAYGWQLILMAGPGGALNWLLLSIGVISEPLSLLYTPTAVVIGQVHVNLPMMVLPLAAAIGKIDPNLRDAARTLGAPWWEVFLRVTLPLSMPGLVAGVIIVFSLTAGAFVTPVVLGGPSALMLGNLIEQQIFTVFDWPFGAVISFILIFIVILLNTTLIRFVESRKFRRAQA